MVRLLQVSKLSRSDPTTQTKLEGIEYEYESLK
jgi:hypothetical protein